MTTTPTPDRRRITRGQLATLASIAAALAVLFGISALGGHDITKDRVQRSLAPNFANEYVRQAALLGKPGLTSADVNAQAQCDKGGPKVADVGPGADWICRILFNTTKGKRVAGKFELQIHANSCYVAGGPSKLIGLVTLTDTHGNTVPNPVFEFDGCLDPQS